MITRIEDGVSPSKNKYLIELSSSSITVNSMGAETIAFIPPVGKIWVVVGMDLLVSEPIGGSSGVHSITLKSGDIDVMKGESIFSSHIIWQYSHWDLADSEQKPSTEVGAQNALKSIHITREIPLNILYYNETDVSQMTPRHYYLSILETTLI